MLDAGGGGGGTPWESMTIQAMQTLIQNPDTEKHWDLVNGWTKSADLINEHRHQVQNYRDNLAAAWPPNRSSAAAAYLARLDTLIDSLRETYEAAVANHDAFSTATVSLSLAQKEMQKIFEEHQNNEQLLLDFKTQQEAKQNSGTPQPTPSPSGEQPPVAPGRQEELHRRAVTLLHGVSTELAQAQIRLVKPAPYIQLRKTTDPEPTADGTFIPPVIPQVVATPALNDGTGGSSTRPSAKFPTSSGASLPTPPAFPLQPSPQQPGVVLGGTNFPAPTPPSIGSSPTASPVVGAPGAITAPAPVLPVTGGLPLPREAASILPPTNGSSPIGGALRDGTLRAGNPQASGLHAMPPGGMIGGASGAGLGQPGSARPGMRRVNPVGGMIGEPSHSTSAGRPGSQSSVGLGSPFGSVGRTGSRGNGRTETERWDPDNPWQTADGVDPVVLPPREQRIDPGPAIGLR